MGQNRLNRINEEILKVLSQEIRGLKDPRVKEGLVSVVRCDVTGDLRYATAYVSVLADEDQKKEVMKGIKSASGFLRRQLSHILQLRYTPEIIFKLDDSINYGAHISELLNKTHISEDRPDEQ